MKWKTKNEFKCRLFNFLWYKSLLSLLLLLLLLFKIAVPKIIHIHIFIFALYFSECNYDGNEEIKNFMTITLSALWWWKWWRRSHTKVETRGREENKTTTTTAKVPSSIKDDGGDNKMPFELNLFIIYRQVFIHPIKWDCAESRKVENLWLNFCVILLAQMTKMGRRIVENEVENISSLSLVGVASFTINLPQSFHIFSMG